VGSILAACVLTGVVTIYQEPYVGRPLYCSSPAEPRYYDVNSPAAWIALDAAYYESGRARCGDQILVTATDDGSGWAVIAQALDAGPLSAYYIEQWPGTSQHLERQPIVADLPAHLAPFSGLSAPARLLNLSELRRQVQARLHLPPVGGIEGGRYALIP
jgi:hypothetical protein